MESCILLGGIMTKIFIYLEINFGVWRLIWDKLINGLTYLTNSQNYKVSIFISAYFCVHESISEWNKLLKSLLSV